MSTTYAGGTQIEIGQFSTWLAQGVSQGVLAHSPSLFSLLPFHWKAAANHFDELLTTNHEKDVVEKYWLAIRQLICKIPLSRTSLKGILSFKIWWS